MHGQQKVTKQDCGVARTIFCLKKKSYIKDATVTAAQHTSITDY